MEALHGEGRAAQRPHLRGQGGRSPDLGGDRGRAGPHRQALRQGRQGLEGGGRPALAGGHRHRGRPQHRRRVARPLRGRVGAPLRWPLRPLAPAQQWPGQRRGLRPRHGERQPLGRHHRRGLPLQHSDQGVGDLHREERAHGGDLELRGPLRRRQGAPGGLGQRESGQQNNGEHGARMAESQPGRQIRGSGEDFRLEGNLGEGRRFRRSKP